MIRKEEQGEGTEIATGRLGRMEMVCLFVACVAIFALSLPGLSSPKLLDDFAQWNYVSRFAGWRDCFAPDSFGFLRPFKNLVFYGFIRGDLDAPPIWHTFNLGVYLLSCVSVYFLVRRLLVSRAWAFGVMLVWGISPTQVSTAIWLSCVNISLAVVFLCGFLIFHLRRVPTSRLDVRSSLPAALFLVAGLFSYESVVSAVGLAFLCDQFRRRKWSRSRGEIMRYGLYLMLTLGFIWLRSQMNAVGSAEHSNRGFPPGTQAWQVFLSAPWFFCKHLLMWIWPPGRVEFASSYVWGHSVSAIELVVSWIVVVLGFAALIFWKRAPSVAFGVAWFYVASFPASNFVPIFSGPIEDYYVVLPSIGLAIAWIGVVRLVWTWSMKDRPPSAIRRIAMVIPVLLLISRAALIPVYQHQSSLWSDPEKLYRSVVETRPYQYLAQYLIANECFAKGKYDEALRLASEVVAIAPWHLRIRLLTAQCLVRKDEAEQARQLFIECLASEDLAESDRRLCRRELGGVHLQRGEFEEARKYLLPLVERPNHQHYLPAVFMLAETYRGLGEKEAMREVVEKGLEYYPNHPVMVLRSKAYLATEETEESDASIPEEN